MFQACGEEEAQSHEGQLASSGLAQTEGTAVEVEEEEEEGKKTEERQSKSHDQASERLQISDASLRQGLPPPRRLPLHHSCSSSHVQQSSRPAPRLRAVSAHSADPHTHTHAFASCSWSLACPPQLLLPL